MPGISISGGGSVTLAELQALAPLDLESSPNTAPVFGAGETGDTVNRVELRAGGNLAMGPGGSTAPDTILSRTSPGTFSTNGGLHTSGPIDIIAIGSGLKVAEGGNAKQGVATLVGGTVSVGNTTVTASSRIIYSVQTPGGTQGFLSCAATPGTGFVITSTSVTDTSVIAWEIFEPG
jgi:hypothetical protein